MKFCEKCKEKALVKIHNLNCCNLCFEKNMESWIFKYLTKFKNNSKIIIYLNRSSTL